MESAVNTLKQLGHALPPWAGHVVSALIILIVGMVVARVLDRLVHHATERAHLDPILGGFLGRLLRISVLLVAVIVALDAVGVKTTSLVAVLGAAGLAIGFAVKDYLSNFAAGVILMVFRPFKAGDFIDVAGTSGIVEQVNIFHTVLRSTSNQEIVIPNSHVYATNIVNYSARPTRRIDLVIGIGYSDDIVKAKTALAAVAATDERLHKDPEPVILVDSLGESSIDLVLRVWTNTADYWVVRSDLLEAIKARFDADGISIPFPQRDVHLYQAN